VTPAKAEIQSNSSYANESKNGKQEQERQQQLAQETLETVTAKEKNQPRQGSLQP
jgi:hypothetical protein